MDGFLSECVLLAWPALCQTSMPQTNGAGKVSPGAGLDIVGCVKKIWTTALSCRMTAAWDWSPTETSYRDQLFHGLILMYIINLPLPSAVYKGFQDCWYASIRVHSRPDPSFSVCMAVVSSFHTASVRSVPKPSRSWLCLTFHLCFY